MTPNSNYKIIFFGECMLELSGDPLTKSFGGDTLNTATYLNRLTHNDEITVFFATGVGQDEHSQDMINAWRHEGINTHFVERIQNKQPGLYMVETDGTGERHFSYWRNDSAAKHFFNSEDSTSFETALLDNQIDAVYLSGISIAILDEASRKKLFLILKVFSNKGGKIIFDNNFRSQLWTAEEAQHWYEILLPIVEIALITEDDDTLVWGSDESVQDRCLRLGVNETVIKRGSEPCKIVLMTDTQPTTTYVSAIPVSNVVDTCAAGDSFAAGYLAARFVGKSPEEAARQGHEMASVVIQHPGAIISECAMKQMKNHQKTKSRHQEILEKLKGFKIIPVIEINKIEHAIPLAKTLTENGLPVAEVTFRTDIAAEAITAMNLSQPTMLLGAGTILSATQVDLAKKSGCEFVVSPGFNLNTIKRAQQINMPIVPGVNNPTQVEQALEHGITFLKFFPAEPSGGINMAKSLLSPYKTLTLMPTGGINKHNIQDYLSMERIACCGGSWMVPQHLINDEKWDEIGRLIREAVNLTQ